MAAGWKSAVCAFSMLFTISRPAPEGKKKDAKGSQNAGTAGQTVEELSPTGKPRRVLPPEGGKIKLKLVIFEDMCLGNDTARPASVLKGYARQAVSPLSKKAKGLFRQAEPPAGGRRLRLSKNFPHRKAPQGFAARGRPGGLRRRKLRRRRGSGLLRRKKGVNFLFNVRLLQVF